MVWADGAVCHAQDLTAQQRVAGRVSLGELREGLRERVQKVLEQPTVFGTGPAEAFGGRPELYTWLLNHPDGGVQAWRRLGAKCTEITPCTDGKFCWKDGRGSQIKWQCIQDSEHQRIWFAEGNIRPGLLLPSVPVQLVVLLRHGQRPEMSGRTLIFHQAYVFLLTDNRAAALITRVLGSSAPALAEQWLAQLEMFFSGLVWYLDQHPDRVQNLLGDVSTKR
jgi:hypothetical protein